MNLFNYTNKISKERMLIVISAPSLNDKYYRKSFKDIINFDINFAKAVMGRDNIIVLVDNDTIKYFKKELPDDILLEANISDIWIRDFSTVIPSKMVQFVYDRPKEKYIQNSFKNFSLMNKLRFKQADLKVDGGNIVDNNRESIIVTEKILRRNPGFTKESIIVKLKKILGVSNVAIIPMDEEYLGHADGMVMFINDNTVVINDYSADKKLKLELIKSLKDGLKNINIFEVSGDGCEDSSYGPYGSAYGLYVNSLITYNYIYMPIFNNNIDCSALQTVQMKSNKKIIPIDAENVSKLGGSVRCLSWQLTGENADKLIKAARKD
ncbi:MAG TPA: agmatine deiminase family protein [Victivallales bacterium]|nr:agmatine deiminase family protein [Victivallales bacterium]